MEKNNLLLCFKGYQSAGKLSIPTCEEFMLYPFWTILAISLPVVHKFQKLRLRIKDDCTI
jgi:hypothetical protein